MAGPGRRFALNASLFARAGHLRASAIVFSMLRFSLRLFCFLREFSTRVAGGMPNAASLLSAVVSLLLLLHPPWSFARLLDHELFFSAGSTFRPFRPAHPTAGHCGVVICGSPHQAAPLAIRSLSAPTALVLFSSGVPAHRRCQRRPVRQPLQNVALLAITHCLYTWYLRAANHLSVTGCRQTW